jgi:hypothetical protein
MSHRAWKCAITVALTGLATGSPTQLLGQEVRRLFPARELMPSLVAAPRDPVTKAALLYVEDNPDAFGDGFEAELALGITLPVYLLAGSSAEDGLVVGIEGGAYARFGLQITERELVNTDWLFAVPLVWHRGSYWLRLRYYHTSSHLGDEYSRRFDVVGDNFSRDAVDALGYLRPLPAVGLYGGLGYAYNVHPEDSGPWTLRLGAETSPPRDDHPLLPYVALDVQLEEDNGWDPRFTLQAGVWLPTVAGRRAIRLGLDLLTGPTPLGQFQGQHVKQLALGLFGNL